MSPREPLLALRIGGLTFALEPGRTYRIGNADHCDVRVDCAEEVALVVEAFSDHARIAQPASGALTVLRRNGAARLSGIECAVVADDGEAVLLPDPLLRKTAAVRATQDAAPAANTVSVSIPTNVRGLAPEATFADMVAEELRRAPWFAISIVLHGVAFAIAWVVLGALPKPKEPPPRYSFEMAIAPEESAPTPPAEIPVVPETLDEVDPEPAIEKPGGTEPSEAPADIGLREPQPDLLVRVGSARVPTLRRADGAGVGAGTGSGSGIGDGNGDVLGGGAGTAAFRKTVSELRKTGLEIVFVFDSTGSMGSSIRATKDGIAQMLDVLRALVPDARFSLVTYRDKGPGEDYLVRSLPLDRDFYAAVNWMQNIEAEGGGDTPEAVLAGMRESFRQDFRRGARRVVVVAGDAPPHDRDRQSLREVVRRFAAEPNSAVHTLLTSSTNRDAKDAFTEIAKAGRGLCLPIQDHDRLLRQVLTLAFGTNYENDLDAVQKRLAAEQSSPPTWARDLARRGGPDLAAAMAQNPVPSALVHALLRRPSRAALLELVATLAAPASANAQRQAAAHVLQQKLELRECPIEAENPRPISSSAAAALRQRVLALPE